MMVISFGSDPKEKHNSDLQSPLESHKEVEIEHISVGCEEEKWVGEQAIIVTPHKEENMAHGELVNSDFMCHCVNMIWKPLPVKISEWFSPLVMRFRYMMSKMNAV